MKAFKAKDFTKELTGADPMTLIRNKIAGYYGQVWEKELMNIAQAVLAVAALSDHVLDLTKGTKTNIEAGTIYDAEQAALGDMAGGLGLMVMHSMIFKEYKKMEMVDYDKYVVNGVIQKEITLPTIAGKHVLVTDRFTATGAGADDVGNFEEFKQRFMSTVPKVEKTEQTEPTMNNAQIKLQVEKANKILNGFVPPLKGGG